MAQNEFTTENRNTGIQSQKLLDAGINVFALDLLVESFSDLAGKATAPIEFTYKGVSIRLQVSDKAK